MQTTPGSVQETPVADTSQCDNDMSDVRCSVGDKENVTRAVAHLSSPGHNMHLAVRLACGFKKYVCLCVCVLTCRCARRYSQKLEDAQSKSAHDNTGNSYDKTKSSRCCMHRLVPILLTERLGRGRTSVHAQLSLGCGKRYL